MVGAAAAHVVRRPALRTARVDVIDESMNHADLVERIEAEDARLSASADARSRNAAAMVAR